MARKLAIMIPTHDGKVHVRTGNGLLELGRVCKNFGIDVQQFSIEGHAYIENARNSLVDTALKQGATDLMFIDSDIIFSGREVIKLLAHAEDKKIVCGIYRIKRDDVMQVACNLVGEPGDPYIEGKFRNLLIAPTGFFLVRREVYEDPKILEQSPMYYPKTDLEGKRTPPVQKFYETGYVDYPGYEYPVFQGEDVAFTDKLLKAGYTVWADCSISLGHVGLKTYYLESSAL